MSSVEIDDSISEASGTSGTSEASGASETNEIIE